MPVTGTSGNPGEIGNGGDTCKIQTGKEIENKKDKHMRKDKTGIVDKIS